MLSSTTSSAFIEKCDDSSKNLLQNRTISLPDWLNLTTTNSKSKILDLRCNKEQEMRRLKSSSFIPLEYLEKRSFELPPRHVEFTILLSGNDLDEVESFLLTQQQNGRRRKKKPNPWKVSHVLLDSDDFWSEAQNMGMVFQPSTMHNRRPQVRLWQPDSMVENILLPLLVVKAKNDIDNQRSSSNSSSEVWDLAAGTGRDVAFLAESLHVTSMDYKLIAIDHRYNAKETKIVNDFFDRIVGVGNQISSLKLNLSSWKTLEQAKSSTLVNNQVAAMFCVRFWKPHLVEGIANSKSISSGVFFALSHFCKPTTGASWNFDHPSEKTVLERNQLFDLFKAQWDIIYDEIALDSDHGRTMVHFVARRR